MKTTNPAIIILPLALAALVAGIMAGWIRIGWDIPATSVAGEHGAIMTGSFIGTLICLERSVTHPVKWWKLLPLINGSSILFFLFHQPVAGNTLLIIGSTGLLILMGTYLLRDPSVSNSLLTLGAFAWLTGNLILLNHHLYPMAVKWWMLFLLWTVLGERLELSRMLPVTRVKKWSLYAIMLTNLAGTFFPFHSNGNHIFAASLLALACWLILFDMSRYAIRHGGQHRYIALWLITGYLWLAITALWLLFSTYVPFAYDAVLHSFFLGFVFSMIFGHVPIIFPGIIRINISLYHPALSPVFICFQFSLASRITGDVLADNDLRKWGAMINGISVFVFFIATVIILITRLKNKKHVST